MFFLYYYCKKDNLSFNFDFSTFQVEAALTSDGEEQCVQITQQNLYLQVNNYDTSQEWRTPNRHHNSKSKYPSEYSQTSCIKRSPLEQNKSGF